MKPQATLGPMGKPNYKPRSELYGVQLWGLGRLLRKPEADGFGAS